MNRLKLLLAVLPLALALNTEARQLNEGDSVVGAALGLGWGGVTVGGSFERGIRDEIATNVNLSAGVTGIYTNYSYSSSWNVSHTFVGAMANLNYYTPDLGELQPYAGLTVGYNVISIDSGYTGSYGSGVTGGGQIGTRYYFSDTLALNVRLGFPITSLGLDYRF